MAARPGSAAVGVAAAVRHHRVVGERASRVGDHGLGQPPVRGCARQPSGYGTSPAAMRGCCPSGWAYTARNARASPSMTPSPDRARQPSTMMPPGGGRGLGPLAAAG